MAALHLAKKGHDVHLYEYREGKPFIHHNFYNLKKKLTQNMNRYPFGGTSSRAQYQFGIIGTRSKGAGSSGLRREIIGAWHTNAWPNAA